MSEEIQHELEEKFQLTLADWINKVSNEFDFENEVDAKIKLTNDLLNENNGFIVVNLHKQYMNDIFTKIQVKISLQIGNYEQYTYQFNIDELLSIGWYIKNE